MSNLFRLSGAVRRAPEIDAWFSGFFYGATLDDPADLLEGTGKRMRHVKLRSNDSINVAALDELVAAAYRDIRLRLKTAS